jgi:hypothetical protein
MALPSGEGWWVSTDAVLTGAWKTRTGSGLVLLFVNVSDEPVDAVYRFEGARYGLAGPRWR